MGLRCPREMLVTIWRRKSEQTYDHSMAKCRTLIQVALLFLYILHATPTEPKKRKREKRKSGNQTVLDDPSTSLEVLIDRLSVWYAVAELGTGLVPVEGGIQAALTAFWTRVVKPL